MGKMNTSFPTIRSIAFRTGAPEFRLPRLLFILLALFSTGLVSRSADVPEGIWVRPGYKLTVAESTIKTPRFMELGPDGVLFVSVPKTGQIYACRDKNSDGVYEEVVTYVEGHDPKNILQGLQWHDGWLWFAEVSAIYKSRDTNADGKADEIIKVIGEDKLPVPGAGHRWRALLIHNGRIYTHIGDQTNATDEPIDANERKKIWSFALDGSDKQLFATGVRNTEKFAIRPGTDEIWGVDHDVDMLAWELEGLDKKFGQPITDHNPPAELNHYQKGKFYGHPYILGRNMPNLNFLKRSNIVELAAMTTIPEWTMAAHCSGNGMLFYHGKQFPNATGDAFVAMRGSWNATRLTGYCLARVLFEDGHPYGEQKMVSFLKNDKDVLGRPADCVEAPDGSILISDDTGNKIYRLTYVGDASRTAGSEPAVEKGAATTWSRFVAKFLDEYFQHRPDAAVNAGRHEFDGQLPDWSPAGLEKFTGFLQATRAAAQEQAVRGQREEFEREYLTAEIDSELFWLSVAEAPFTNPYYYSNFGGVDPNVYLTREYAPLDARLRAFNLYLRNLPAALRQIRANLRTPMPRTFVKMGRTTFGGLASFFEKDVPEVFQAVRDGALQQQFKEANAEAVRQLKELDRWFEEQGNNATEGFALNAKRFQRMLWETERVNLSLDELERIGRLDLERNTAALRAACEKLAPGKSVAECLALVRARKPAEGPVAAARRQLTELKTFLVSKDLVTIPGPEQALVDQSPPYMRWNFAYINIPGPYEKGLPATYYIAPPEPTWSAQEQLEYIPAELDLLFTSVHEVWPGHFLQFLHANRSPSKFGQVFVGYAFAEGWAHYSEELMWEAGLGDGDPAVHIGQLLNALLRNARFLSAIGLHKGSMSVEQSEQLFREAGFQDAATARQQAARGTFDPAYLNYTMGKLMIRKLRDDWCASRGGRAAWKQFHDQFLAFGGPPIPLVRKAMLGDTGSLF